VRRVLLIGVVVTEDFGGVGLVLRDHESVC